jgi:hypothetical protein
MSEIIGKDYIYAAIALVAYLEAKDDLKVLIMFSIFGKHVSSQIFYHLSHQKRVTAQVYLLYAANATAHLRHI